MYRSVMYTNTRVGTAAHAAPSTGRSSEPSVATVLRALARTIATIPPIARTNSSGIVAVTLDVKSSMSYRRSPNTVGRDVGSRTHGHVPSRRKASGRRYCHTLVGNAFTLTSVPLFAARIALRSGTSALAA